MLQQKFLPSKTHLNKGKPKIFRKKFCKENIKEKCKVKKYNNFKCYLLQKVNI